MQACIICGSSEKTISKVLRGMKISLCVTHADHAIGDTMEAPLLKWI